ncbi:MAG: hypothetical protein J0G94_06220, partial [Sphingomonadales bacterium]|nr:hypothetical protein [Sphingomonadales bacterium]
MLRASTQSHSTSQSSTGTETKTGPQGGVWVPLGGALKNIWEQAVPGITVQITPLLEMPGAVLLVMQDASAARALDRQLSFRGAARSVTGMAAILAHEVKNPLSGIRGAAQLLEASVAEPDRELALLIRDEADRIRDLVDRMEMFGEKPIERSAVNIHRVLERVRKLAQTGFAAHIRFTEVYDPSLPPVWGNRDQLVQV